MAPTTGAWTSEDPVWREPRYGYTGGRPSYRNDPSGRVTFLGYKITTKLVAGVGLCGAAAGAAAVSTVAMAAYVGWNTGALFVKIAGFAQPGLDEDLGFTNDVAVWAGGMSAIAGGLCAAVIAL